MKLKQLVSIRDTLKYILDKHGEKIDNNTKVDMDNTLNFINNIITDAKKEKKGRTVLYALRIEYE